MRKAEIILKYQNLIHQAPEQSGALMAAASKNDDATMDHFQHVWLGNITANKQHFGNFKDYSLGQEFRKYQNGVAIVAGSGPSLKVNAHELKNRGNIPLISCLHNFHMFEDLGLAPEYYVTLDAQELVIDEVTEGGSRSPEEYWEMTKDRTLVAFIGSPPSLLRRWKGRILLFNAPIPRDELRNKIEAIEKFNVLVASGGNVLGACLYISKAILGTFTNIFVGADFSFGYNHKFHAWDSKYDADLGVYIMDTDIYGIRVPTWETYHGFKKYFMSVAMRIPGHYYNCSEGGCLGSYPTGNIDTFKYMDLKDCLSSLHVNDAIADLMQDPSIDKKQLIYL